MEALPQDLADFLVTRNFDPEYFDDKGQPAEAGDAKTMKFDYVAGSGKNYGTAVCVIADNELSLFYGDNLGRGMEQEDKQDWFSFLEQLSNTAASHAATWSPRDINQLKHTLAGIAAIKEGLFEGYYGTKKISYMGEQTQARLVIKHNRTLGEDDKRYRYVESLFIETAEQERFRLPFKSLSAGRAMLEHVRSGGNPYDVRGNHITEIVGEMAVLSRFNRAQHHRVFEGVTQQLVESARQYYHNLQETVRHLGSPRGYQAYFESWAPDQTGEAEALVENLRNMFVEQTLDARIEAALPTLAKIQQQGNNMKEAEIFESWINQLSEGTWALPDTPETQEKLNQLMSGELIVGPDATNATELLYDIVGDDELFDILNDLADRSEGRANIWDDSDVQRRLAELGVQTPQSTQAEPANVPQDTAPVAPPVAEGEGNFEKALDTLSGGWSGWHKDESSDPSIEKYWFDDGEGGYYASGNIEHDLQTGKVTVDYSGDEYHGPDVKGTFDSFGDAMRALRGGGGNHGGKAPNFDRLAHRAPHGPDDLRKTDRTGRKGTIGGGHANKLKGSIEYNKGKLGPKGVLPEGDNQATFVEDAELAEMLKYAGVSIKENVLTDSTGGTLEHIKDTFKRDVKDFTQSGEMSDALYDALYDYYFDDMPYGTKKARDGDPYEWVADRFAADIGLDEGWKGALTGAALGGALGSIVPGLGTIQGAIAGGYAGHRLGDEGLADPDKEYNARQKLQTQQPKPVSECNYTMEGEYCPEHGLTECGMADGGAVGMPYSMGEAQAPQDPMNSNSAMTGSYYEGKESRSQEGDALLARIKSLALLR